MNTITVDGHAVMIEAGTPLGTLIFLHGGNTFLGAVAFVEKEKGKTVFEYRWLGHYEPLNERIKIIRRCQHIRAQYPP